MDNIINLAPSPRALHFAVIKLHRRNWIFLACSLAFVVLYALVARALAPHKNFFPIILTMCIVIVCVFLTESYKAMRAAKRLTDLIKPSQNLKFEINKDTKFIYTVKDGKIEIFHYDMIMKVIVVASSSKLARKHSFKSIVIKYLEFLPFPDGTDDVKFGVVRFDHLENANELANLISEGEPSLKEIKNRLLPEQA
jgi:hypothetical protein